LPSHCGFIPNWLKGLGLGSIEAESLKQIIVELASVIPSI
jgi:hypothetical protein